MVPEAPLWPSQEGEWGTGHMNNLLDPHSGLVHTQVLQVASRWIPGSCPILPLSA